VLSTIDIRAVLDGARELRERLTARQREVLTLVARGATNARIAERLSISEKTVGKHLEHFYETLGVVNRTAAAARWLAAPT
jgi:Response regulator containing a CheY-like receiver domain and an HTH DNA-binding domain